MDDNGLYLPHSDFLNLLRLEEIGLEDDAFGNANLAQLIALTTDPEPSNRDWAIFLLSQSERDSELVRHALRSALRDPEEDVRDEALVGLAKRSRDEALPLVLEALDREWISELVVEAASYVAHSALLPALHLLRQGGSANPLGGLFALYLNDALVSCANGKQPAWRPPWD